MESLDPDVQNNPAFFIEQWPASDEGAKATIASMMQDQWAIPLPAYTQDGKIIAPSNYARDLEGASVWLEFDLQHRASQSGDDFLDAFIRRIRVLEAPTPYIDPPLAFIRACDAGVLT